VLPVSRGDKEWYLDAARTRLLFGVASRRRTGSASSRSLVESFGQSGPRRHIFIHNGAPQALFDSYAWGSAPDHPAQPSITCVLWDGSPLSRGTCGLVKVAASRVSCCWCEPP